VTPVPDLPPDRPASTYEQAVRSWTEHLRGGGTTPWSAWVSSGAVPDVDVSAGRSLPGAAQLEVVRRLALVSDLDGPRFARLADVVLHRSAPGRGLAQQPLAWPATSGAPRRFGAPPTDPSDVPLDELVRVAIGTLTALLLAAPAPVEQADLRRRRFTRSPAFALAGAPVTTSAVRRALGAAGHAEGGASPRVVLLADPFDVSLAQVWSARVQRGAPVRWSGFVERWANRRELPPSADYPALAQRWAAEVGADAVHVLVAPRDAVAETARLLGVDLGRARHPGLQPRWKDLSPASVDVARRVNAVLNVRAGGALRAAAVRACAAALVVVADRPRPLTVPGPFRQWATERARRVADDLGEGGYPVLGDLVRIVPRSEGLPTGPRRDDVLRVALDACLHQALKPRKAEQR
jgi:hypothetical protein